MQEHFVRIRQKILTFYASDNILTFDQRDLADDDNCIYTKSLRYYNSVTRWLSNFLIYLPICYNENVPNT